MVAAAKRRRGSFVRWILKKIGWTAPSARRVQFHEQTSVFEFERQLLGGGGVPDGAVSGAAASPATERACAYQPCSSESVRCSPAIWSSRDAEFCFSCSSCELSEWSVCMWRPNSSIPAAAILDVREGSSLPQ